MRHPKDVSRRQFLARAGGAAIALPSLSAILAACSKPSATDPGSAERVIARPDLPVTLPMNAEPIAADTPVEEGATLLVYNWVDYVYKKVVNEFADQFNCQIELTTFNNMEEGIQKIVAGQVKPDVFFPTVGYLSRLVDQDLIQPLQHELIPNMQANVWKSFWDPGPWYDRGWEYSVPYTIYTTGVAYRRDRIDDATAAAQGYDLLWNADYSGAISYYDSYSDAIGMALLRNGVTDVNSCDPAAITAAKETILQLINDYDARLTINGVYDKLPEGEFTVAQSWSGDIVGAQWYLPKGVGTDVLGYWHPDDNKGLIGNDLIVVPTSSQSPRLAHEFINFFLDKTHGYDNFSQWNGYQPPFTSIDPTSLVSDGVVPEALGTAVVTEDMFTQGYQQGELSQECDALWLNAWSEITAGG